MDAAGSLTVRPPVAAKCGRVAAEGQRALDPRRRQRLLGLGAKGGLREAPRLLHDRFGPDGMA